MKGVFRLFVRPDFVQFLIFSGYSGASLYIFEREEVISLVEGCLDMESERAISLVKGSEQDLELLLDRKVSKLTEELMEYKMLLKELERASRNSDEWMELEKKHKEFLKNLELEAIFFQLFAFKMKSFEERFPHLSKTELRLNRLFSEIISLCYKKAQEYFANEAVLDVLDEFWTLPGVVYSHYKKEDYEEARDTFLELTTVLFSKIPSFCYFRDVPVRKVFDTFLRYFGKKGTYVGELFKKLSDSMHRNDICKSFEDYSILLGKVGNTLFDTATDELLLKRVKEML